MGAVAVAFPILTFHSIDTSGSVISMPPLQFAGIMHELASAGWRGTTVSGALAAWRARGADARTLAISFDDAYRNLLAEALPVLSNLGFAATAFVIAGAGTCTAGRASVGTPTPRRLDLRSHAALTCSGIH